MRVYLVVALLLLGGAWAQKASPEEQVTAADTADYVWVVDEEDPADDQTGPTPLTTLTTPNDGNPESDIRRVQMTDDGTTFIAKITMGTCDFGVPSGFAMIILELTAGGADLEMTARYNDGCTSVRSAESDSALGDTDSVIQGLRAEGVPAEDAIYLFSDYAANGLVPGDTITFDRIHTGRQFTEPGRYTFGLDEAVTHTFTVGAGAALMVPEPDSAVVHGNATDGLLLSFDNATSQTHLLNWSAIPGNLTVTVEGEQGNVSVSFAGRNETISNGTLTFDANQTSTLNLTFEEFVGQVRLQHAVPGGPIDPATDTTGPTGETGTGGNGTEDVDQVDPRESPGLPLAAVLLLLALAARRRW